MKKVCFNNIIDIATGNVVEVGYLPSKMLNLKSNDICFRTRSDISKHAKRLAKLHSVTL